jgi:hypothetical protein
MTYKEVLRILGFVCLCSPAIADIVPLPPVGALTQVSACLTTGPCQLNLVNDTGTSLTVNQTVSADGGSLNFQAFAAAQPGTFRASVQDTLLKEPTTPPGHFVLSVFPFTASASMVDQLTASAPGFNGSMGFWGFSVALSGTFGIILANGQLLPGQGSAVTSLRASIDGGEPLDNGDFFPLSSPVNTTVNFGFFPIVYGTPLSLDVILETQVYFAPGLNYTEFNNFSETATITGLSFFDAQMNPVTNVSLTSGSGAIYTLNGVVPEPSFFPFVVGVCLLGLVRLRTTRCEVGKKTDGD